ncbi:MAG: lipocalin-like domain-containing protein [Xanthomonadales bacterium]|nr:lipocalin-like domain-containing protein [Xanthomonadales bacterium]
MSHRRTDFLGSWELREWRIEYADGRLTQPFGRNPGGLLIYSDHNMSATIQGPDRTPSESDSPREAEQQQKADWFDSYFSYSGDWWLEGEEIVHHVTCALNPGLLATHQRRLARFDGRGELTLSALENLSDGSSRRHVLVWRRVDDPT